jgi:hypothetical protein
MELLKLSALFAITAVLEIVGRYDGIRKGETLGASHYPLPVIPTTA